MRHVWARAVALAQSIRERLRQPMHRDRAELVAVIELQAAMGHGAKAVRLQQDGLEHRAKVARRPVDDLEDLSRCRLLLQRLALRGEEPRVLDGDDGLSREVLQEGNLLVGEELDLASVNDEVAEEDAILAQRHGEDSAAAADLDEIAADRISRAVGI